MPTKKRSGFRRGAAALLAILPVSIGADASVLTLTAARRGPADPLAAELARWSRYLEHDGSGDAMWVQVKEAAGPVIARSEQALRDGRRFLALQRLASAWPNLAASVYSDRSPAAARREEPAFEAEWSRVGKVLRADLAPPGPAALEGVTPAAVRGMGEAALPQVRAFYESAVEYARSTMPQYGLFYLGAAQAERDFARFCRTLTEKTPLAAPTLRPLGSELDALEARLLSAYRPPVSIDRHGEFIAASSSLKEARELDAAGLRFGALMRYLTAVQRAAPLWEREPVRAGSGPVAPDRAELGRRIAAFDARLSAGGVDHSIGRMFLEAAQADLAAPESDAAVAGAVASDVLPLYFAALEPVTPKPTRPEPRVTVTLVRWPYT